MARQGIVKTATALLLAGSLMGATAACTNDSGIGSGANVGTVGGAVLGGLAGAQVGGGTGRLIATGIGAVLGAGIGREIGTRMTTGDQDRAQSTTYEALESNQTSSWQNPDSGNSGTVTPTSQFETSGRTCREYQTEIVVEGETHTGTGTACRQEDGSWQIQS